MVKIAIIGGSGLEDPKILQDPEVVSVTTPYGAPSSPITCGRIAGVEVAILSRHGLDHHLPPTRVPNKANIQALKDLGCTHILATTAVGSLREEIGRGDLVLVDQFIDFTRHREVTFHDDFSGGMQHTAMAEPFDLSLREHMAGAAAELGLKIHGKGTVVTIEGPRFSTRAESHMFRAWGADIINMSTAPEAALANEAGIPYAAVAMSTDYDCWKEDEEPVTWEAVLGIFQQNAANVKNLLVNAIPRIANGTPSPSLETSAMAEIKGMFRTIPNFRVKGVMFRDVKMDIDAVAGIESRGFVLGSVLAHELGVGFILLRKPGKLPADVEKVEYTTEYSTDAIEVHRDAIEPGQRILVIDDLIATGGTALAGCQLVEKLGGKVVECAFVVDLPDLGGSQKLRDAGYQPFHLVEFEGE
jgi:5'-methylthioadenosine phosphorylase